MKMIARPCRRQTNATVTAVRHVYVVSFVLVGRVGTRGKNTRKSSRLYGELADVTSSFGWSHT